MSSAGAAAAAAAAAARRRREQKEEQSMSTYTSADLAEGWEFKIVRSVTGAFKRPETVREVLAEEARAGWVLVEKFDNQRMRLKRPASARAGDATLGFDPYRTFHGISDWTLMFIIIGSALCVIGLLLGVVAIATR